MSFLGRKLHGNVLGEIITDMMDGGWRRRISGARIKHRVTENWLKMYDKAGSVPRVEMVINKPRGIQREWRIFSAIGKSPGKQIMAASLCLRDVAFPELFRKNIAA